MKKWAMYYFLSIVYEIIKLQKPKFDLHKGDLVFVEGKLEGIRGIVTEVNRSFRMKLSDYKRVIAVADTDVKGELYFSGSATFSNSLKKTTASNMSSPEALPPSARASCYPILLEETGTEK